MAPETCKQPRAVKEPTFYTSKHRIMNIPDFIHGFQHSDYCLTQIFDHLKTYVTENNEKIAVIVIADFSLGFTVPIDQQIALMGEMVRFVEQRGSILAFGFLRYPPALSSDPKLNHYFVPAPNHTDFISKQYFSLTCRQTGKQKQKLI